MVIPATAALAQAHKYALGSAQLPEMNPEIFLAPRSAGAPAPGGFASKAFFGINLAENQVRATCYAFQRKGSPLLPVPFLSPSTWSTGHIVQRP